MLTIFNFLHVVDVTLDENKSTVTLSSAEEARRTFDNACKHIRAALIPAPVHVHVSVSVVGVAIALGLVIWVSAGRVPVLPGCMNKYHEKLWLSICLELRFDSNFIRMQLEQVSELKTLTITCLHLFVFVSCFSIVFVNGMALSITMMKEQTT